MTNPHWTYTYWQVLKYFFFSGGAKNQLYLLYKTRQEKTKEAFTFKYRNSISQR